jgi:hypothetical protein
MDIDNKKSIKKVFVKVALMINPSRYSKILDISDANLDKKL